MSGSSKMAFSLFFFLSVTIFSEIGSGQDECMASRCSDQGPTIRFPFRLTDQPDHCGYPGFELYCSEKKQTMLELPYSVNLLVTNISYDSHEIMVQYPYNCFVGQLQNLSLAASPFQFKLENAWEVLDDFTFFNCSSNKREFYFVQSIPCLSIPGYPVYAIMSSADLDEVNLSSCRRMYNLTLPYSISDLNGKFSIKWSKSVCGNCEAQGKKCRLKRNSKEPETECINNPSKGSATTKLVVAGAVTGFLLLVLAVSVLYYLHCSRKLEEKNKRKIEKFLEDYRALKPSRYSYADIKKITDQFKYILGQGGYGTVYKGKLSNEVLVAVKILNNFRGNGEEFINEMATMGRIHHVNVVRLVGFCADGMRRALIFEFLPNDSLNKFIFSAKHSLVWEKLQDIAIGIAKGMEYLHQGCEQRILHFDIKPHNILLDHNFNPKISDFGLAKLCSKDQSAVSMTIARGTMGYIAPEVLSRNFGNVSYKSDVYSFGMLLLEMVSGRKNSDVTAENPSQVYFPEWIYNHLNQGEELHIRIMENRDATIAKKLAIVGLWCIQWYPVDRPSMKLVVQMLEGEDNLTMPPNPFASTSPTNTKTSQSRTPLQKELAVISE
ncbi:hypothetical protein VitviT2T_025414 [Vitis vinifera]|uniref:Protein kinase domain-containing protein n=1 Tax=Vitis vinifera TaxID=29760 RepID=A0ABY9DKM7_VITVI|nr:rust resistance kinase Lr10 [Vitis vinifera]WKA07614.1 hypothetical protein VitviT2T_025414 [Vitis vinifera]|eukprot:XP_010662993.1 PREDICTED: rust resistance kinase Lr10 isoform X1 [Vitis vinifera]